MSGCFYTDSKGSKHSFLCCTLMNSIVLHQPVEVALGQMAPCNGQDSYRERGHEKPSA